MIIFKGKRKPSELANLQEAVIAMSKSGWMNGKLCETYTEKIVGGNPMRLEPT
jgi:hypothetical protein